MPQKYQKKFLDDGTPNPKYTSRYQPKTLPDGSANPKYKPDTRKRSEDRHIGTHTQGRGRDTFIAIDGEGVTLDNGKHAYILLCSSTGEYIINPQGLTTSECFAFLLDLAKKYKHGIFCCFGGSYDANMWLRTLRKKALEKLWASRESRKYYGAYTLHGGSEYAIGYRPRKYFALRQVIGRAYNATKKTYKVQYDDTLIRVWDVYSFFQAAFIDTLKHWFSDLLHDGVLIFPDGVTIDLQQMKAMKARRGTFTVEQLQEDILPYCQQETIALVKLMERLSDYLTTAGIGLARWDGAGAIASEILKGQGVDRHIQEPVPAKTVSDALYDAQKRAYFGGRFEASHFGTYTGPVFNYDLHSAFPSVMPDLPSMRGGQWRHVKGLSKQKYALVHIRWAFDDRLSYYPFPFRAETGSIYYPPTGEGWYYRPEIDAAFRAWNAGKLSTQRNAGRIEVVESWEFHPGESTKPFAFVPGLYQQRQAWKAQGNPAEKVLKFGLNSFYGKTIQSIGAYEDDPPRFHQIFWGGWITSAIRAQMFEAMMQAPDTLLMVTADGLYSTVPLDLDIGPGLGQWELNQVDGVIIVQSGVYWGLRKSIEPTEHDGKHACLDGQWYSVNAHYRGFDRGSLTIQAVMQGWQHLQRSLSIPTPPRFVTLASAMALRPTNELRDAWLTWRVIERKLELYPVGKRVCSSVELDEMQRGKRKTPEARLIQTLAAPPSRTAGKVSHPYTLKWLDTEPEDYGVLDGIDRTLVLTEIDESEL